MQAVGCGKTGRLFYDNPESENYVKVQEVVLVSNAVSEYNHI